MKTYTCSYPVPNTNRRRVVHVEATSFEQAADKLVEQGIEAGVVDGELLEEGDATPNFAYSDGAIMAVH